ncbi:beta strand repeat-containing protein [Burkholderia contaminans]|uniref:beta strand repeat-containing protein n=1 Tax=Burkholderia contaminans TaxID=488447 RepID=UPI001C96AACB|nr:ESPR-type extended signal peptide-containing protein [Burkholderia contaminans]MBY4662602.1 YadA-like family protein [Burkholderia contaminans]
MNKTYRNIWNAATRTWTAVAETAKSHSKGSSRAARQAVIAIALGGAAIGSAAAADMCTTVDGSSGTVDASGACKATGSGAIGTMGTIGTMAALDDTYFKVNSTGTAAAAGTANSIAIGQGASVANGGVTGANSSIAIGNGAAAGGTGSIMIGTSAQHSGSGATVIGSNANALGGGAGVALGTSSSAAGNGSVALGASTTASGRQSIALGTGSVATADNTVSVGSATLQRRITNVANGTAGTDAVNFGQLSATNAAVDATNAGLSTTNASLASMQTGLSTTNVSLASTRSDLSTAQNTIATHTTQIDTINNQLNELSDGTIGLVQQSTAGANLTVGANTDGAAVNFAGTAGDRKLTGIAAGTADSDAVNFGQLSATNAAVDATKTGLSTTNASLASTQSELSTTNVSLASTQSDLSTAQTNIATHTTQIDTINNQLNELSDGTIGLVQQSAAGADLTVGANTDGAAVNFAGTAGDRKLTGIAAGTTDSDAVNFGQLSATNAAVDATNASLSTTNASLASTQSELSTTNVSLASTQSELSTTNVSLASTRSDLSTAQTTIATHTTQIDTINNQLNELSDGTIGLLQQSTAGADLTVGANTDGAAVNFAGTAGDRKLTGIAAGTGDSDAVNFGQLSATNAAVDATNAGLSTTNASLASTQSELSTTNVSLASTQTELSTAQTTIATHTTEIDTINNQLSELSDGTIGLVQQSAAGADLTVGANTDGAAVNFAGSAGTRKLTGITAGDVSAASTDAVNGSQLHGVADSVASAIGGGSTVNPDGSITAPSFTVGDGHGGTTPVGTVADAVSNLDGRTIANEGAITDLDGRTMANETAVTKLDNRVTTNEGAITKLADQIGSGTLGLVQQANAGDDLTVGANTDGAAVNFTGTAGNRTLTGVAAGDVSAASSDAVNGSQLHGVADSVASAIGGGSTVNADGSISAPSFTVGDGSGGTKIVNSVGDVVTNLDGRVTDNEGGIKKLADQLGSGTVGLVRQDATSGMITVGAGGAGSVVNFAGSGGPRVLSGVANGVHDDDVVTVSQLRATGLIDYTGKEVGAVTYDSGLSFDSVTFSGTNGTVLKQVAAGFVGRDSMEAVNGGQLYALQEEFAKQYGDLSGRFDDLSSRVGELETNPGPSDPGTGGPGAGGPGTGEGSTVVGEGADASGKNSSAIGNGAVASGENSSAIGQGSVASGKDSTAVGQGSVASGEGSTALGQGASATGSNSVAIGQGSVATEANTVSFGDGTPEGNRRLVNIADGINASDAATRGQLDRAMESVDQRFNDTNRAINDVAKNAYAGIAAAMAMPNMTPSQPGKTVVAVGTANFKSGSAIAAGATYRSRNGNWLVNGATSVTSVGDVGIRAQVGYEF